MHSASNNLFGKRVNQRCRRVIFLKVANSHTDHFCSSSIEECVPHIVELLRGVVMLREFGDSVALASKINLDIVCEDIYEMAK